MGSWGLVRVSVADLRKEPDPRSEQVTQAILGMAVEILGKRPGWLLVSLPDGYIGWLSDLLVEVGDQNLVHRWSKGPTVMVTSPMALIYSRKSRRSPPVSDAVIGTRLRRLESGPRWCHVRLPDHRDGWIAHGDTVDQNDIIHLRGGSPQQILKTAYSFTGFPYLWGGTTPKGFDCSGFVQTVFRLNGHCLPRDAHQQFTSGTDVPRRSDSRPADLFFFRTRGAEKITHVAIHLGHDQFIHCSGYVRTNSLDRSAGNYDASLEAQYVGVKRIVGGASGRC